MKKTKSKSDRIIVIKEAVSFPARSRLSNISEPDATGAEPAFAVDWKPFVSGPGYKRDTLPNPKRCQSIKLNHGKNIVALNETQPDTLPTRLVSAFTPGREDGINFLSQCQLGRGFTSNCAEFC